MRLLFILTLSINLSVACLTNEGASTDKIMRRELPLSGYVCAKPLQELMYGKYKVVNASGEMLYNSLYFNWISLDCTESYLSVDKQ